MTVHELSGKLAAYVFWFNPWSNRQTEISRTLEDIDKIQKSVESLRKKIHKLPWRKMAEQALSRYQAAYGQNDLEASFLDGWRLLEASFLDGWRLLEAIGVIYHKKIQWLFIGRSVRV
ncbi:MAG: hypothetical protein GQ535_11585 [Rhodobacteraceae bacterium]|nr:hypothetical protein [Paracoccaceae bacterium]